MLVNNWVRVSAQRRRGTDEGTTDDRQRRAAPTRPLIEARSLTKYFGSVIALYDVSLHVRAGEVLCLLGDNGAGKSTLIKTLSGVHPPDAGEMLVDGEPRSSSTRRAMRSSAGSRPSTRTWR